MAEVAGWAQEFSQVEVLLGPRFGRREPRARAVGYVRSLLAPLERKNGWTISEATGARSPDSVQWLLTGADWDPDLLRDDLRDWVAEQLGDPGGVLIVDDTGFLKKGLKSAGVQRQYSGTAGRVENCQICECRCGAPAGRTTRLGAGDRDVTRARSGRCGVPSLRLVRRVAGAGLAHRLA